MPANLRPDSNHPCGTNEQPVLYLAFELSWDSGELRMLELRAQAAYEEYHREDRGWVGTDGTLLEVVRGPDGAVSHLVSETYLFTRTPYDANAPIPGGPPEHA